MQEMPFQFEHIGLPAKDPRALKDWYVQIFGAEVVHDNHLTPPAYYLKLPDGSMIEIYKASISNPQVSDNQLQGWRHVALRVKSLDEARLWFMNRGVIFHERIKPAVGGGVLLYFKDPEGNLLHLVERTEDSPLLKLDSESDPESPDDLDDDTTPVP